MIKLYFDTDTARTTGGIEYHAIRVWGYVSFKLRDGGFSKTYRAIYDTGAPMSLIPLFIWEAVESKIKSAHELTGINNRKECVIPCYFGEVKGILLDEDRNYTDEIDIPAYLAKTNRVPLILGMLNVISRFKFYLDCNEALAYLE